LLTSPNALLATWRFFGFALGLRMRSDSPPDRRALLAQTSLVSGRLERLASIYTLSQFDNSQIGVFAINGLDRVIVFPKGRSVFDLQGF